MAVPQKCPCEAEHGLPDLPLVPVQNWVSKEFTNLSRNMSEAWMRLHNATVNNHNLPKLQQQYKILYSRTNRAAEKVMKNWWSTKAKLLWGFSDSRTAPPA